MKKATPITKESDVKREWHLVDANGKVLGRIATMIAEKLMGKSKPYFVRNVDCGDNIVVINAATVAVTGHKEEEKVYSNYSGYPGGLKQKSLKQVRAEQPEEIIRHAVWGMLPKNHLRHRMITRLFVYPGSEHPHAAEFAVKE